ncbi:MAG TPA: hypothetical protein VK658_13940 [Chryseolinea sp.]|nr:hypothetical protein [Chryseolinea sp.]
MKQIIIECIAHLQGQIVSRRPSRDPYVKIDGLFPLVNATCVTHGVPVLRSPQELAKEVEWITLANLINEWEPVLACVRRNDVIDGVVIVRDGDLLTLKYLKNDRDHFIGDEVMKPHFDRAIAEFELKLP